MNNEDPDIIDDNIKRDLLTALDVFKGLDNDEISLIIPICKVKYFFKGEVIFEDNAPGDDLFVIIDGEVSVQLEAITPHFDIAITKLVRGQIFGEMALIDNEPRSAKVSCFTECACLVISGSELRNIFEANTKMGYKVMFNLAKIISRRIRKTNRRLLNVVRAKLF